MTANAKSSDLQWESAESTSWGRWKCSPTRPSGWACWSDPPRRRPAGWRMHAASWAAAELRRSAPCIPIPHCDGPRCRHGSPRRLRGGARAPRSVAPVSGATPGRFPRILERGECLSCTAAGTRFSTSSATSSPARRTRGRQKLPPGLQGRRPTPGLWSSSFDGSWILSMRAARRLMEGRARSRSRAVCAARRAAPRRARAGMGRAGTWAEDASENPSGGARQAAAAAPTRAR